MADNILKTRLISAYNTLDYWSTATTIPLGGEVCYAVDDDNKILEIKIGDGVHTYAELPTQAFDNDNYIYALGATPSTANTAHNIFKADIVLNGSNGGSNSTSNLQIPAATTTKAGAMSTAQVSKLNNLNVKDVTYTSSNRNLVIDRYSGDDTTVTFGTMAFKSSADFVGDVSTAAYNTSGVTIKETKGGTASTVANFGSAVKSNITTAIGASPASSSTNVPTDYAVWKAIDDLPEPMIFKGSVGTASATTSSLPTPSASNEGWVYKAITTGTSAVYHDLDNGETAASVKVGDSLISNGTKWVRIPSGDEPSGTVTSITIKANSPITIDSSAAITTSGTRTISHAAGNSSTTYVGPTADASGLGATIKVPYLQADKYGHITTAGEYTLTNVTSAQVKGVKVDNASTADFATSAGDSAKLNGVDASNYLEAGDIVEGTGINVTTAAGVATVSADLATTTKYNGAAATVTAAQSTAIASRVYAVQPDKNGDLAVYIPWTDTNTKVTSVGNHYTPASSGTFTPAAGGTTTNISDTAVNYIAGLKKDAAGHITSIVSGTLKADKNTNYYTTAINQTTATDSFSATVVGNNSAVKGDFSIPAAQTTVAGVMTTTQVSKLDGIEAEANKYIHPSDGSKTGTFGASNAVPVITVNSAGHVTSVATVSVKDTNYYATAINQTTAVDGFTATVVGNNSAVKGNFSIPAASANNAGVMTTSQVNTLSKVKSATTTEEGLTKKPSGTAPISVDANNVISHDNSGVTAGTYGTTAAQTPGYNSTFAIPWVTVNAKGHITGASTASVKIPASDNTNYYTTAMNQTTAADSFSATVVGNNAAVKGDFSIPAASTESAGVMTTVQASKLAGLKQATAGSGLSNSDSGDTRTINHASTITAGSVGPSANATVSLQWGKTSAVSVPYISYNNTGHTTAASTKTISFTMPSNPNTNYYTTAINQTTAADGFSATVVGNNSAVKGNFSIPEATETVAGVSSTVSTDRLRNGVKTLILNGNFTTA